MTHHRTLSTGSGGVANRTEGGGKITGRWFENLT
jgi:hypothetical protein